MECYEAVEKLEPVLSPLLDDLGLTWVDLEAAPEMFWLNRPERERERGREGGREGGGKERRKLGKAQGHIFE